jgi:hypothetical protein
MPSMFVRLWRGISLGGVATTSCQMCWSSRAVGSCGWYWRWRKMVLSNLSCLLRWRRSWSSFERDMNANALWVALWNSGVSVVVLCPRLTRRRKKARVCLRTSCGDEQRWPWQLTSSARPCRVLKKGFSYCLLPYLSLNPF